jgi:hypothetical protein
MEGIAMTRSAKVLWLILLTNAAMIAGVLAYGLGRAPFHSYVEALNWFGVGALLAVVALTFANICGFDTTGGASSLEEAPPRVVRLILGVIGCEVMAVGALAMGLVSTVSLLGR